MKKAANEETRRRDWTGGRGKTVARLLHAAHGTGDVAVRRTLA